MSFSKQKSLEICKLNIEKLEHQNKRIKKQIENLKEINPWYPVQDLTAKIGGNSGKISRIKK